MHNIAKMKNITRIDIKPKDGGRSGYSGWMVRIKKGDLHVTKAFSIDKYGGEGALSHAVAYRDSIRTFDIGKPIEGKSPSIFLSYAKEDKEKVDKIYLELKSSGLEPWMDRPPEPYETSGLGPGKDWEKVLKDRIRESDYVMAFISKASGKKRGYVQNELRQALKEMNNIPESVEYLIPVCLEECEVPDLSVGSIELRSLQWFELYKDPIKVLIEHVKGYFRAQ